MSFRAFIRDLPDGWDVWQLNDTCAHARYEAPEGTISLICHELTTGMFLSRIDLQCQALPAHHPLGSRLATLNWCASGRCEVDFGERGSLVVGQQTLCLSSAFAQSYSYPTGSYQGFEYFIDFDQLGEDVWAALGLFGLTERRLREVPLQHELGVTLSPTGLLADAVHSIETELASERARHPWLLLETFRLLMLLAERDLEDSTSDSYLQRSQRDIARAVHQRITEQGSPSANLGSLSEQFGVSEASLRSYFVRVYGETPASYARTQALTKAVRLLVNTDTPVVDVSQACGYANPSKFSAAFKRRYHVNPLEYRRRSRL